MSTPREVALAEYPDFPFIDPDELPEIESLMRRLNYLEPGENITGIAKAGEGNMNLVLRVSTDRRSVILKQARPWVERYDMIAAPWGRIISERRFYERIQSSETLAEQTPELLGHDDASRTMLLEDLGAASDLSCVYGDDTVTDDELSAAARFLRELHDYTAGERSPEFENPDMRALNHTHIYDVPLTDHGMFDLDELEPGLSETAAEVRSDRAFVKKVHDVGRDYLNYPGDATVLLHGDYFPGSLVRTERGMRVIDPEFCFAGPRCFDVATMTAHLILADAADQAAVFLVEYDTRNVNMSYMSRCVGCEVMRRLIGVAQLPIPKTDGRRADLLTRARDAVMTDDLQPLLA
ncbi:MAG: phosphotransferase [Planctomycetota bacterium]